MPKYRLADPIDELHQASKARCPECGGEVNLTITSCGHAEVACDDCGYTVAEAELDDANEAAIYY